jgi:DNA repair ATPase RecN
LNHLLNVLIKPLQWSKQDIYGHMQHIEKQLSALDEQIQDSQNNLSQSYAATKSIQPELEINRLRFMTHTQEKKSHLQQELQRYLDQKKQLLQKLKDINCKLNLFERAELREQNIQKSLLQKKQEQLIDEWAQKRSHYHEDY